VGVDGNEGEEEAVVVAEEGAPSPSKTKWNPKCSALEARHPALPPTRRFKWLSFTICDPVPSVLPSVSSPRIDPGRETRLITSLRSRRGGQLGPGRCHSSTRCRRRAWWLVGGLNRAGVECGHGDPGVAQKRELL
jgi:hypothetical protein